MPTIDLLGGLQFYVFFLSSLMEQELKSIDDGQFLQTVSLEYNSIKLKLDLKDTVNRPLLYLQADFRIEGKKATFENIYIHRQNREKEVKKFISSRDLNDGLPWDPSLKSHQYNPTVVQYVAIADEIAKMGYHCSSGDDYATSYYSRIIVTDDQIELHQTNHYNSRSTDHKDDYHLRDLEFYIPIKPSKEKSDRAGFDEHWIGGMRIYFSDRSSANNRGCGNSIRDKIEVQKADFKKVN
ncbi:MAG: hypothetical protein WKF87_20530 [Chryseolinea sp.]